MNNITKTNEMFDSFDKVKGIMSDIEIIREIFNEMTEEKGEYTSGDFKQFLFALSMISALRIHDFNKKLNEYLSETSYSENEPPDDCSADWDDDETMIKMGR
jgi:hypothetical protein